MPKQQIPSNNELKEKIRTLSDEELNQVAGGGVCRPDETHYKNGCWTCQKFADVYGINSSVYIKHCIE